MIDLNKVYSRFVSKEDSVDALFDACTAQARVWLIPYYPNDFDDLAQQAVIKAWQKLSIYDPKRGSFRTWFFHIVRSVKIDHFRNKIVNKPVIQQMEDGVEYGHDLSDEREYDLNPDHFNETQMAISHLLLIGHNYESIRKMLNISRQKLRTEMKNMSTT
jgi:RNA polymerase sigma factor (sigma-70 family)